MICIGSSRIYNSDSCNSVSYIKYKNDIRDTLLSIKKHLGECGIAVTELTPEPAGTTYKECNLLWVRDMFVMSGGRGLVLRGDRSSTEGQDRSKEYLITKGFLQSIPVKTTVLPISVKLEGGDVIQSSEGGVIFVGRGRRTNQAGIKWLRDKLEEPYPIKTIFHRALHLDGCFAVLGKRVFYSPQYIPKLPEWIYKHHFEVVSLEDVLGNDVDHNLATNFIQTGPKELIISDYREFSPFRKLLRRLGYRLRLVNTNRVRNFGGSIRCLTQWITKPDGTYNSI